jgi:hypothetical protein
MKVLVFYFAFHLFKNGARKGMKRKCLGEGLERKFIEVAVHVSDTSLLGGSRSSGVGVDTQSHATATGLGAIAFAGHVTS